MLRQDTTSRLVTTSGMTTGTGPDTGGNGAKSSRQAKQASGHPGSRLLLPQDTSADVNITAMLDSGETDVEEKLRVKMNKYRRSAEAMNAFYPVTQPNEGYTARTDTTAYLRDVDIFNDMRRRTCRLGKAEIRSEWIEPFLWVIGELQWSDEYDINDDVVNRRRRSCTFTELTCAVDILTGGRVGDRKASLTEKTAVCKKLWKAASATFKFKRLIKELANLPTLAPFGFMKLEGLSRRPRFAKWDGLPEASVAIPKVARNSKSALQIKHPRAHWVSTKWESNAMAEIPGKISEKRKGILDQELQPDMLQRNIKRSRVQEDQRHQRAPRAIVAEKANHPASPSTWELAEQGSSSEADGQGTPRTSGDPDKRDGNNPTDRQTDLLITRLTTMVTLVLTHSVVHR